MKMTNMQINELNELLSTHGEVLTAFYDEGIQYGLKKGLIPGILMGAFIALGAGIASGLSKIQEEKNLKKKES